MSGQQGFDPGPILAEFPDFTAQDIADALGVTRSTVNAWRCGRRGLRFWTADELAIRIGSHPASLWPDWVRP